MRSKHLFVRQHIQTVFTCSDIHGELFVIVDTLDYKVKSLLRMREVCNNRHNYFAFRLFDNWKPDNLYYEIVYFASAEIYKKVEDSPSTKIFNSVCVYFFSIIVVIDTDCVLLRSGYTEDTNKSPTYQSLPKDTNIHDVGDLDEGSICIELEVILKDVCTTVIHNVTAFEYLQCLLVVTNTSGLLRLQCDAIE